MTIKKQERPFGGGHGNTIQEVDVSGLLESIEKGLCRLSDEHNHQTRYRLLKAFLEKLENATLPSQLTKKIAIKYVECALEAFRQAESIFAHHSILVRIAEKARSCATATGDKRSTALLDLQMATVLLFINDQSKSKDAWARALATIEALGDKDFAEYTRRFLIMNHVVQGEPLKALDLYKSIRSSLDANADPFVLVYIVPLVATHAAFVGQFRFARRLLTNASRTAEVHNLLGLRIQFNAGLALLLLAAGDKKEARTLLDSITESVEDPYMPVARFLVERATAYLLFTEGNILGAHEQMSKAKMRGDKNGLTTDFVMLPWLLQMLHVFHWADLPPIPGLEYERAIRTVASGLNLHMRGVAYRLLAFDAGRNNEPLDRRLKLLHQSEEILSRVSGNIELAKTWIDMARLYLGEKQNSLAREFAIKAHEILSSSAPALFPDDLLSFIDSAATAHEGVFLLPTYSSLVEALACLPAPLPQQELYSRITSIVCSLFGAERAGLFAPGASDRLNLICAYNIPSLGAENTYEETVLELILRSISEEEPIFSGNVGGDQESATALCIPLSTVSGKMVLYLAACGAMDILNEFSQEQASKLAWHTGRLLSMFLTHLAAAEDAYRQNIGLITSVRVMADNDLLFRSAPMKQVIHLADLAAQSDVSVIVLGETGVGKELVARHIHRQSNRREMPFVTVDITALPESLVESELFGHEKGSFTGANEQRAGQIELADKGTLFIDEIGDAPIGIQLKLLRVLQEKTYRRVGGTKVLHSDFRLIVATNKDLQSAAREGRFREDLYYRLNVISVLIPPLRDRTDDITYLASHFLGHFSRKHRKPAPVLTKEHERSLMSYNWPGNVRELKNLMERAIVLQDDRLLYVVGQSRSAAQSAYRSADGSASTFLTLDEIQVDYIRRALEQTGGRIAGRNGAAKLLGLKRTSLYTRMKKLGMTGRN